VPVSVDQVFQRIIPVAFFSSMASSSGVGPGGRIEPELFSCSEPLALIFVAEASGRTTAPVFEELVPLEVCVVSESMLPELDETCAGVSVLEIVEPEMEVAERFSVILEAVEMERLETVPESVLPELTLPVEVGRINCTDPDST
jgi:hypothetical protein